MRIADNRSALAAAGLLLAATAAALAAGARAPGPGEPREVWACEGSVPEDLRASCVSPGSKAPRLPDLPETAAGLKVDYPEDGSVFPPDIAPPTILWHDGAAADRWFAEIAFDGGAWRLRLPIEAGPYPIGEIDPRCVAVTNEPPTPTAYQASSKAWKPSPELWTAIKRHGTGGSVRLTLYGATGDESPRAVSRGSVAVSISRDPVGAPIFYRDVPLMPSAGKDGVIKPIDKTAQPLIAWRLKDVSRTDSRLLLENMPTCANCHSFSADGKTLGMDVDGPDGDKGAYALAPIAKTVTIDDSRVITWNAFPEKPKGQMTLGFLARVSPDGRYVVATVNERLYVRNFTDYRVIQVFFPTRGILAVHDRESGEIRALPGADDPRYVHCNPVWTPDGKELVFMRAPARDPYDPKAPVAMYAGDPSETQVRFDLYRIPFNGGRGGTAVPIPAASGGGVSHSFPKVSPDGKWLVWTQSKNGMLLRPDGKLWIAPLAGGRPRLMRCNTPLMNSWHSFSPSGRWMVFSSKANTPYTQMFLTHLDEDGNDSPAILVEGTTAANRAVNIPEFVNIAYDDLQRIEVPAVAHREHFYRGNELAKEGKKSEAIAELEKALEGDKKDWRTYDWKYHDKISRLLLEEGRVDEAIPHIEESLRQNPSNAAMHANLGSILFERGNLDEARRHLDLALRLAPSDAKAWYNRGAVRLSQGDAEGALGDYDRALVLEPGNARALGGRGMALWVLKDTAGARAAFDQAIEADPKDAGSRYFRAMIRRQQGDLAGALDDLDRAAETLAPGSPQRRDVDNARAEIRAALSPR